MNNNEFNYFKEENHFKENKSVDVLPVNTKDHEISSPQTEVYKSKEFSSSSKKQVNNKDNKNFIKKILQKVTESTSSLMSGVAATATVVVTSVVLFSNIVLNQPLIEMNSLIEGYDYVEYNISLSDPSENTEYYVLIDNNYESFKFDLDVGENINKVSDLTSDTLYYLTVIGINEENQTETEHFKTKFFTKEIEESFKVTWMLDDTVLKEENVQSGQIPSYTGIVPTKEETIDYIYKFIGWDKELTPITSDIVYKAVFEEIKKEYLGSINLIDESDIVIYWDNEYYNQVVFNTGFDNCQNLNQSYRIILTDKSGNEYTYQGIDSQVTINVPKDVYELTITYELIEDFNGIEKVYDRKVMENSLILNIPTIEFDSLVLTGIDEYELLFMINSLYSELEQYKLMTLNITYSDNTNEVIKVDNLNINESNVLKLKVPSYSSSVKLEYTLELLGNNGHNPRVITGTKTYELTNEYYLNRKMVSNQSSPTIIFDFIYHFTDELTTVAVKDTSTNEITVLDLGSTQVSVYPTSNPTIAEYEYYLSTIDGEMLESGQTISVDYTEVEGVYNFNYINPGDAVVTFNDDGTVNIYLNTFFETEEENIYYSIVYNNFDTFESTEVYYYSSGAAFENVSCNNYGIVYYVYKEVDGVQHILEEIYVSGGVEFTQHMNVDGYIITEDDINYQISFEIPDSDYLYIENSIKLTIDGIDYGVDINNLIHDEQNGCYRFTYSIDFKPTNVVASYLGFPAIYDYDLVSEYLTIKGNKYTTITINFL